MSKENELSLIGHLEELRIRIIKSLIAVIVFSCICFAYADEVLSLLIVSLDKLVFLSPQEAFIAHIKVAIFLGIFLSSPFILYQVWKFVIVALYDQEIKYLLIFGPLSLIFFILGICFGYLIIVPIGIKFLLGFATKNIVPMISVSKYISFVGLLTLTFGVVFELPLVILFLSGIGIVSTNFLISKRKHAVVAMFIVAALVTPPDIITQCLMAVPLLILYELGIIFSRFSSKNKD